MQRPHRAWAVCVGGALMLFTAMGLATNVFSVYQPYIIDINGFTNAQGSWIPTVRSLFILLGMMTADRICVRLELRRTAAFSLGVLALSYLVFGAARTFPVYCVGAALSGLGYSWGGMLPLSLLIDRWFEDRKAFALGLGSAGSGFATILAPAPLTWLIENRGLSAAFWAEAAFIFLTAVLVWLLVRDRPEDVGLSPYRTGQDSTPVSRVQEAPAGMNRALWAALFLGAFLTSAPTGVALTHIGVLYTSEGYDSGVVAALVSCAGLAIIVGKLALGELTDRLGGRLANYIVYATAVLSLILLCLAPVGGEVTAFAAVIFFGMGLPVSNVSFSLWAKDFGGDERYAWGVKWFQSLYALGLILLGPLPGMLADVTGSYVPAYMVFLGMMALSMFLVSFTYERTRAGGRPAR